MENASVDQRDAFAQLRQADPAIVVRWDEARGVAASARGTLAPGAAAPGDPVGTLRTFLEAYGPLFGPAKLWPVLKPLARRADGLQWTHLELQQWYSRGGRGGRRVRLLEVYGAKLVAHFTPDGSLVEVQSSCWRDIQLAGKPRITAGTLRRRLARAIAGLPGVLEIQRAVKVPKWFPMVQAPRLVIYPWQGRFRLAWTTYAYTRVTSTGTAGESTPADGIELGHVFVDAVTGEQFLFSPTRMHVAGSGSGVTPLGGPYVVRNLNVSQVGTSATYELRDTTHTREIIAYDGACDTTTWRDPNTGGWKPAATIAALIAQALSAGAFPVSSNVGGTNWDRVALDTTDPERTASQQPGVDAHFFSREAYEWYDALAGGRAGWDNGGFPGKVEPNQPVRVLTHLANYRSVPPSFRTGYSQFDRVKIGAYWVPFILFCDGDPTLTWAGSAAPNNRALDYPSGAKALVGHEYQHAITYFSFTDASGDPGISYYGWSAAVHEGLSDTFGCLFAENWTIGPEISTVGLLIRNLVYPRDPGSWENTPGPMPRGLNHQNKDHFADRTLPASTPPPAQPPATPEAYDHGTILAHTGFLLGAGGVHQRASRAPELIPVQRMGREVVGGKNALKAARVWYLGLSAYSQTLGTVTGTTIDENMFRGLRDGCVSAALQIYGNGSRELATTVLAFYAVGLQPPTVPYGADVTFLTWGADWRQSRPYLGGLAGNSPDWSSVDLFVNSGSGSGWNAVVNALDANGNPTQIENSVYCRVRNVGDQDATGVKVEFFYAKIGTSPTGWLPVKDRNGVAQVLNVGTIVAGQSTFADSAQGAPPPSAGVKWWIPPLAPGEIVDHFCLKAQATCANDVNPFNNEVQSNIAYIVYDAGGPSGMGFYAANPKDDDIPLELRIEAKLPDGWSVELPDFFSGARLRRREERRLRVVIHMPHGAREQLEPPLDGEVAGSVWGPLSGPCLGQVTGTSLVGPRLTGRVALQLPDIGTFVGAFDGTLDVTSGQLTGPATGTFTSTGTGRAEHVSIRLVGRLKPWRRVDISQLVGDWPIGGFTIEVQHSLPGAAAESHDPRTMT